MTGERIKEGSEAGLSGVEALEKMKAVFQEAAVGLIAGGVTGNEYRGIRRIWTPTTAYMSEFDYPRRHGEGSQRYRDDAHRRQQHGYMESISMVFDVGANRLKTVGLSVVLPGQDQNEPKDTQVWRIQQPREVHANGQQRMILDVYTSPGSILTAKIAELKERHGAEETSWGGTKLDDVHAYNVDLQNEYHPLWLNLYKRTDRFGVPLAAVDHERIVLGGDGMFDESQEQAVRDLEGLVGSAVALGVQYHHDFEADPANRWAA